jgi:hypothetical protein
VTRYDPASTRVVHPPAIEDVSMMVAEPNRPSAATVGCCHGGEVVEMNVLLSGKDFSTLESLASRRGLTCGQFVRRVLTTYLAVDTGAPAPTGKVEGAAG